MRKETMIIEEKNKIISPSRFGHCQTKTFLPSIQHNQNIFCPWSALAIFLASARIVKNWGGEVVQGFFYQLGLYFN